jgi:hypothetical protein
MAAGGVAYAGWKAANASNPMGQPVVECEAAVEADVNQLFDCAWPLGTKEGKWTR